MQTITTFAEKLATILIKLDLVAIGALMLVNYNQSHEWHLSNCN
jgi:hypothetical protein